MTELPGLPPFGAEPAFAADDAAYGAVAARARNRRRTQLAAVSAAAALVVAVAVVSGPGTPGRVGLEPTADPPTATTTPAPTNEPAPEPSHAPGTPGTGPGTGPGYVAGTDGPPGSTPAPSPTGAPAEPSPDDGDGPYVVSDCVDEDGNFVACGDDGGERPRIEPRWRETSGYVDDRIGEECSSAPVEGWCLRYLGPRETTSGMETDFTAELCRLPNGRGPARIDFLHDRELAVSIGRVRSGGSTEFYAISTRGARADEHSRPIDTGRCLRWTVTWNGVDDDGRIMRAGTYRLFVGPFGVTPREPAPGEPNQGTASPHAVSIDDFVIR